MPPPIETTVELRFAACWVALSTEIHDGLDDLPLLGDREDGLRDVAERRQDSVAMQTEHILVHDQEQILEVDQALDPVGPSVELHLVVSDVRADREHVPWVSRGEAVVYRHV